MECKDIMSSIQEIPESYLWSEEDRPMENTTGENSVPLIDLEEKDEPKIMRQLRSACENGFFQIVNHGVPHELLQSIENQARLLFSLPLEEKLKARRTPDGLAGYGVARIASFFPKQMWSEGFTWIGSAEEHAKKLWPHDYDHFCHVKEKYEDAIKRLALRLVGLISGNLELNKSLMEMIKGEESFGVVQMNHYPVCWQPHRTMGMAPHTDSSLLSLLYQGGVEGLQFQLHGQRHEEWIVAPALPNGLVVILGDLIQVLSNGRYKSAVHRAVPNSRRSRISLAYIWGPSLNAVIKPWPDLVDSHHPLSYKAFTWSEYLRAKAVHFNTALQFFKQS